MQTLINRLLQVLVLCFTISTVAYSQSLSLPAGWTHSNDKRKNAISLNKQGDNSGTIVKIYPKELLVSRDVDEYLSDKLSLSKAPKGKWLDDLDITRATANIAYGSRGFVLNNGIQGSIFAYAFSADRLYARLGVSIYTLNESSTAVAKEAIKLLASNVSKLEKAEAVNELRGLDLEVSPPDVAGIKQGGVEVKPGLYAGNQTQGNKTITSVEIMLYANEEFEFLNQKKGKSGQYVYSESTGRLNLADDFFNSTYNPHKDFSVFGIDETTNKHVIYAEEDRVTSTYKFRLTWTAPPDRLAPSIRKELERQQEIEDSRYKYTTTPGNGINTNDIEAVLHVSNLNITLGGNVNLKSDTFVLMNDGRVMDSPPVAPTIIDVSKSRSREPDRWGWWIRDGAHYSFAWSIDRKRFTIPEGTQVAADPLPQGLRLTGTWQASQSNTILDAGSVSFWGVRFTNDGRFDKFNTDIITSGGELNSVGPMTGIVSTEEGTTSVIIGSNIGGGTSRASNNPKSERQGSYEFDGYNLTLNYDNGQTVQLFTFTTGDDYKTIWFEGASMLRQ